MGTQMPVLIRTIRQAKGTADEYKTPQEVVIFCRNHNLFRDLHRRDCERAFKMARRLRPSEEAIV